MRSGGGGRRGVRSAGQLSDGSQLHGGRMANGELWRILAVGLPPDFAPPEAGEDRPSLAQRALAVGAFVAAAHPAWNGTTADDIRSLGGIHAVETWNATAHVHNNRADSWYVLDQLLASGSRLGAYAADDAHFDSARPGDALQAWVWVRSESLDRDAVVDSPSGGILLEHRPRDPRPQYRRATGVYSLLAGGVRYRAGSGDVVPSRPRPCRGDVRSQPAARALPARHGARPWRPPRLV